MQFLVILIREDSMTSSATQPLMEVQAAEDLISQAWIWEIFSETFSEIFSEAEEAAETAMDL